MCKCMSINENYIHVHIPLVPLNSNRENATNFKYEILWWHCIHLSLANACTPKRNVG